MGNLGRILEKLLDARFRIVEWQILSGNPVLHDNRGIAFLKEEREQAAESGDHCRIQQLSSKILLLERCGEVGLEKAFFGRTLDEEQRECFDHPLDPKVKILIDDWYSCSKVATWEKAKMALEDLAGRSDIIGNRMLKTDIYRALGNLFVDSSGGDRATNIENAISSFNSALAVISAEEFPGDWSGLILEKGNAYMRRIRGDRSENLETALELFRQALTVFTIDAFPEYRAEAFNRMAVANWMRIMGNRSENQEQAIACFMIALEVFTRRRFPESWASIQTNLANVYRTRICGDRAENIERAIALYRGATEIHRRDNYPALWALAQNNMANAFCNRIHGDGAENHRMAIELYENALSVRTRDASPENWAQTLINMAIAYRKQMSGSHADNIEKALGLYLEALKVYTRESHPLNWANVQNSMAVAYADRIRGNRSENLERAIALCKAALEVRSREAFPEKWATTANNLAITYRNRIRGDRAENLERAIELYEDILRIRTRFAFPFNWADLQCSMAVAYKNRVRGDRDENLERAVELYGASLEVWTRHAFPVLWAKIQNNLANAYRERLRGDREQNIEKSIAHYRAALEVRTREKYPQFWGDTRNNLAIAYRKRIRGDRAENLEKSIAHYEAALEVRTRDAHPLHWAMTSYNTANVYLDRIHGNRDANLHKAIEYYGAAHEVLNRHAFPRKSRELLITLSGACMLAERWRDALRYSEMAYRADRTLRQQSTSVTGRSHETEEGAALYYRASLASAHLGETMHALEWLERGKTRELGELLARDRAIFARGLRDTDRADYVRLIEKLEVIEAEQRGAVPGARSFTDVAEEAREVHGELNRLVEKIQQDIPEFLSETTLSPHEVKALLNDGRTVLVVFNITEIETAVILVGAREGSLFTETFFLKDFTLDTMKELAGRWIVGLEELKVEQALTSTGRRHWRHEIDDVGRRLYRELFRPVRHWLKTSGKGLNRLVFVPHLSLHILPLHLVRYDTDEGPRYLIEEYEVGYTPSISLALKNRDAPREQHGASQHSKKSRAMSASEMLLLSNPTRDLVFSEEEAKGIIGIFPGRIRILSGDKATGAALINTAPGAKFLHLSCHGKFDPEEPWNSGLYLASERVKGRKSPQVDTRSGRNEFQKHNPPLPGTPGINRKKGKLMSLREIFTHLDLSATDLVVLSACETGLVGFGGKSDEFVGLPGGILRAGARSVIASLWTVDDQATATLMELLYRYILVDGQSPPAALRRAQLEIMKNRQWRNPFYWGAFRALGV